MAQQPAFEMQHQPRPFEGVTRRSAVRSELILGCFLVVVAPFVPLAVEVLDDTIVVGPGVGVNDPVDDGERPRPPLRLVENVGELQEGLGRVHVAVAAAIRLVFAPVAGKPLTHAPFVFGPEPGLDHVDDIVQQRLGVFVAGLPSAGRRQRDEGVNVGLLGLRFARLGPFAIPAAVLIVVKLASQCRDAVCHQRCHAGLATHSGQRETVRHAGSDHGVGVGIRRQSAVFVQRRKTALGMARGAIERQQALAFALQPVMMCRPIQPAVLTWRQIVSRTWHVRGLLLPENCCWCSKTLGDSRAGLHDFRSFGDRSTVDDHAAVGV